jgi:undecaprenyl-diphosphatase
MSGFHIRPLLPAMLLLLAAAVIGLLAMSGHRAGFDVAVLRALSPRQGHWDLWLGLMYAMTEGASVLPRVLMILLAATILVARGRPAAAGMLIVTCASGALLVEAIKDLVRRPRPAILPQLDIVHSYSFPSAHASNATIVFGAIALLFAAPRHRVAILAFAGIVAFLTGLSRLVLAVHWPTDVLAGWCLGLGWLILCFRIAGRRIV